MTIDQELAAFCEQEQPRLVGLLALYVGDVHVAEELAQDALIRVCQHWPRVRLMQSRSAWVNRVAMNLAKSMFRRRGAAKRAMARHGGDPPSTERDDATTIAVRQAVAALPPRMRAAVIHRHFLGDSVRQTAESMGCAEGTVKSLTFKALAALRDSGLAPDGGITTNEPAPASSTREFRS